MSVRASTGFPSSCSGDMYDSVPTMTPSRVTSGADVCAEVTSSPVISGEAGFARPKSSSFTPDFVSMTLAGFRSRWTMPFRCAAARAAQISEPMRARASVGIGPRASRAASVSPSRSSVTAYETPLSEPKSKIARMFGWDSDATARASRSKRASASGSAATRSGRTLMATSRPRRGWWAR